MMSAKCGRCGSSCQQGACSLLQLLWVDDTAVAMDEVLFASVVEACIRTGSFDLLADRTRQLPHFLTAPTYGSMNKTYGQSHDVSQVWALWKLMLARGVQPTSITLGYASYDDMMMMLLMLMVNSIFL